MTKRLLKSVINLIIPLRVFFFVKSSRASVATRAVNPGVVNLNPSSANFFLTFHKSQCDKRRLSSTNGQTVYVKKQSVASEVCCVDK